jgi:hypothetical protein
MYYDDDEAALDIVLAECGYPLDPVTYDDIDDAQAESWFVAPPKKTRRFKAQAPSAKAGGAPSAKAGGKKSRSKDDEPNASRKHAGHAERMAMYRALAEKGIPLFGIE